MSSGQLARELGKRNPFDLLEQEVYLNLARTYAVLAEPVEKLFRQHGLCPTHYNILRILAGEEQAGNEGLPMLEVRNRLVTRVPDITRLVDKLEEHGLIFRDRSSSDRRVFLLKLTDKGRSLAHELREPLLKLHKAHLGHLSSEELQTLCRLLEKARNPA